MFRKIRKVSQIRVFASFRKYKFRKVSQIGFSFRKVSQVSQGFRNGQFADGIEAGSAGENGTGGGAVGAGAAVEPEELNIGCVEGG